MNYFEHHIGDYDQATAHLTACEDGIYHRLIRWYMANEGPLPNDLKAIQRRVRAHTRDERAAVVTILREFFSLRETGYHQHRCDEGIAAFKDKQDKARRSAQARWTKNEQACDGNANAYANASTEHTAEQSEGNAPRARPQSPITKQEAITPDRSQRAEEIPSPDREPPRALSPTAAGESCLAMRKAGLMQTNPSHPGLLAAIAEGGTAEQFGDTAREAVQQGKGFAWVIATVRGRLADAARAPPAAAAHPHHAGPTSKVGQAILELERMKSPHANPDAEPESDGVAVRRVAGGNPATFLPGPRQATRR